MSNRSWYERKFGTQPSTSPQGPTPQRPGPFQQPQQQQQQPQPQMRPGEEMMARGDVVGAAYAWEGGEGTRTETNKCPQCGSNNFFSRQNRPAPGVNVGGGATGTLVTQNGRFEVASRCFDCNYNGLYDLQG